MKRYALSSEMMQCSCSNLTYNTGDGLFLIHARCRQELSGTGRLRPHTAALSVPRPQAPSSAPRANRHSRLAKRGLQWKLVIG